MHTQEEVVRRISCDITTYWAVPCSIAQYPVVSGSIAQYPVVSSSIDYRAVSHTCHWGGRGDGAEYRAVSGNFLQYQSTGVRKLWYRAVSKLVCARYGIKEYRPVSSGIGQYQVFSPEMRTSAISGNIRKYQKISETVSSPVSENSPTAPQGVPPIGRVACSVINLSLILTRYC